MVFSVIFVLVISQIDSLGTIHFFSAETAAGTFILGLGMVLVSRKMPKKSLLGVESVSKTGGVSDVYANGRVASDRAIDQRRPALF
jgi:hypothetical protein